MTLPISTKDPFLSNCAFPLRWGPALRYGCTEKYLHDPLACDLRERPPRRNGTIGKTVSRSDTSDLEDLLRAANRGDSEAYERFLRAVTPILRGIVTARGARLGPESCEDVLQGVLLAVHLKRHTWREDLPVRPWLYAVARHKVIDALRARGAVADGAVEPDVDSLPAPPAPDALAGRDLDRLLDRLGVRDSQIIRAIGVEGDSAAEAAARFGMTEGAIRVALHRALKRIARLRQTMLE